MKKRFTEEQIIGFLHETDAGLTHETCLRAIQWFDSANGKWAMF